MNFDELFKPLKQLTEDMIAEAQGALKEARKGKDVPFTCIATYDKGFMDGVRWLHESRLNKISGVLGKEGKHGKEEGRRGHRIGGAGAVDPAGLHGDEPGSETIGKNQDGAGRAPCQALEGPGSVRCSESGGEAEDRGAE